MRNKVTAISTLAAGIVLAAGGTASAHDNNTHVHGGDGFSSGPVVVNAPQQGLIVSNGTLVDLRCSALLRDLDVDLDRGAQAVGCNTGKIEQTSFSRGGLLF
jgi:hypothetical protein